jgi:hypothetical protein
MVLIGQQLAAKAMEARSGLSGATGANACFPGSGTKIRRPGAFDGGPGREAL